MTSPVGTRGTDYEMVVERGKIAEFAAAMQSQNPAYAGPGAIVPPTFLMSGSLWAPEGAAVDVGFDRRRLLHGEQEFIFHGPPPRAGQVLTVSDQIIDRYSKPGKRGGMMRFAVVVTEYRAEDGTLVAEARKTLIETAPKGGAS
jgi:N-terminal half of MaoC dehydratase